ncbi:NepR family anti-sigma factor [Ancylobacter sp. MQZ15Z-1]|uniref:NepR family anti-sigma factor n=1 Tax=Ancylobacter mangrovi TaxID=2972472 RepID=A0A9X2PG89_9HYPH|nr:NepR family anti-sigma factor [Ancylobacter mangrovi]MCS0495450.1 NepR family anti-sigma factor [Ancylobacter mangrovi]
MNTHLPNSHDSGLGSEIQAKIGQHLRAMYDDVVRQGVPDRFMDLLAQLDAKGPKSSESGDK